MIKLFVAQGEFDHEAGVTSLCMHTDGTSIATGTRDGQVITWDSSTNVPLLQLQGKVGVSLWGGWMLVQRYRYEETKKAI